MEMDKGIFLAKLAVWEKLQMKTYSYGTQLEAFLPQIPEFFGSPFLALPATQTDAENSQG